MNPKKKLLGTLLEALREFENTTGCEVFHVRINRINTDVMGIICPTTEICSIDMDIK